MKFRHRQITPIAMGRFSLRFEPFAIQLIHTQLDP
jgi:hypothetical protein